MKKSKKKLPAAVAPAEPEVVDVYDEPPCADAAKRVKFHLSKARVAANIAMRHIIEAGWELAKQKQVLGYGQWRQWCEENVELSHVTADRYIAMFAKTVGVQRAAQSIGLEPKLLKKELDAATAGLEDKTVRQAMIGLGIVKAPAGWGGERAGAGRKGEPVENPLSMSDSATVMWADAMRPFAEHRAAFHSAARDLKPAVAREFLSELKMLVEALERRAEES